MLLLTSIGILLLVAAIAPLLVRVFRSASGWVLALVPLSLFAGGIGTLQMLSGTEAILEQWTWVPSLGIALSFRLDGLSLLFSLLITGIGGMIVIYSGGYLRGTPKLGRFYAYLFLFMAAMLGLVLADNLIGLFVFWELTSISSYLLIGFYNEKDESRRSALQALLVTGAGGLALLAGIILIGTIAGSYEISYLLSNATDVRQSPLYPAALLLMLVGAFTKSAQVPFHFWLPGAMAAPAPVSAYLHSATMVKAGVYLLARLAPVMGCCGEWHYLVMLAGSVTMFVGAVMAVVQTDLKRLLAYSTVSALGTLVLLLGIGTELSVKAAMVFLLVHSLYKGALFMIAGTIEQKTGSRDVRQLGGLLKILPLTGAAALLAALSMTGFPPLLGFISKELMYEAQMQAPAAAPLILVLGVIANALTITVAIIVGIRPFLFARDRRPAELRIPAPAMWIGPLLMGLGGLLFGLFPGLISNILIEPAVQAVRAEQVDVDLKLWHGINPVFLLSMVTVALGLVFFFFRRKGRSLVAQLRLPGGVTPSGMYQSAVDALPGVSAAVTRVVQSGNLRGYLMIVILAFLVLVLRALLAVPEWPAMPSLAGVTFHEYGIVLLILAATVMVLVVRARIAAIAGLGVVGLGIALLFIMYSAPDLAITQILIETLTVVIFVLAVSRLPRLRKRSPVRTRMRDALIAVMAGLAVTLLSLLAVGVQLFPKISRYYADHSLSDAFGRNVVNVILVDFRALDTLGEVTVLAVAAIGVFALLKLRLNGREKV
ncbi:MAG: putative monovalent cation/H+ antiporter subunit A [Bacteroidetes bacterium]|nr:putative monovalent cation/H+ antiporter subunit A [Bacteroidota bacterium]